MLSVVRVSEHVKGINFSSFLLDVLIVRDIYVVKVEYLFKLRGLENHCFIPPPPPPLASLFVRILNCEAASG